MFVPVDLRLAEVSCLCIIVLPFADMLPAILQLKLKLVNKRFNYVLFVLTLLTYLKEGMGLHFSYQDCVTICGVVKQWKIAALPVKTAFFHQATYFGVSHFSFRSPGVVG